MAKHGKRNRQRNTRKGNGKSTGYNQKPAGMYSYKPAIGPTRALPMPRELSVALDNTDYMAFNPSSPSYVFQIFGMTEFLSYRPLYLLELYQIYKYARVTAVTFEFRVTNQSTTLPVMMAIGTSAYSDASGMTPDRFWERTTTIRKQVSVQGGLDRGVLRKTFVPQDILGQPYLDQKFWIDVSQSASTTPVDTNEPVILYCVSGLNGSGFGACTFNWKIRYHIQMFDLRTPSSSIETEFKDIEMDFDMAPHQMPNHKVGPPLQHSSLRNVHPSPAGKK